MAQALADSPPRRSLSGLLGWMMLGMLALGAWVTLVWSHRSVHSVTGWVPTPAAVATSWVVMSTAMMLPTMLPMLRALRAVLSGGSTASRELTWWAFVAGYLAVWVGVATGAALAQLSAARWGLVDGHGRAVSLWVVAGVLVAAGSYQLSELKRRCQHECVSPMMFFWRWWRDGIGGGWRMGVRHGITCVGCCWALMLLAVVGGMAHVGMMALCTVLMIVDKLPGLGPRLTVPLGVALLSLGAVAGTFAVAGSTAGTEQHHGGASAAAASDPIVASSDV